MNKHSAKFNKIITYVILTFIVIGSFFLGYGVREWKLNPTASELDRILNIIENNYDGDFNRDEFISAAVNGSLDKYSTYYTVDEYLENEDKHQGINNGKIGISFYADTNEIYSVAGNSPAEKAGITQGKVTGLKSVQASEYTQISNQSDLTDMYALFGLDEQFCVRIQNEGTTEYYTLAKTNYVESYVWYYDSTGAYGFEQTNEKWTLIKLESLQKSLKTQINKDYCYVKYSSFYGESAAQMQIALEKMKESGIKKVVLDLRKNGGGYMDILCKIASFFCPGINGQPISVATYKSGDSYSFGMDGNNYNDYGFEKITLLMDSGSASASEALAGAILDYDEKYSKNVVNVILKESSALNGGESDVIQFKTYGKGIMQSYFNLPGGKAIKMTTAHIKWPVSGKCIHETGITENTDLRVKGVLSVDGKDAQLEYAMR